jgi:hypothetical protein
MFVKFSIAGKTLIFLIIFRIPRASQPDNNVLKSVDGEDMTYPVGKCPYCKRLITPTEIFRENTLRRNVLLCPLCDNKILACRTPGCHNYAESGTVWDDEFCPGCTSGLATAGAAVVAVSTVLLNKPWMPKIPGRHE